MTIHHCKINSNKISFASVVMLRVVRRLLIVQCLIILFIAFVYLLFQNTHALWAALYGGCITLSGTLLMAWHIDRAGKVAVSEKQQGYIEIYVGMVQKFILTLLLMAIGMGYLKLDPLAILLSFALTQLSFIANKVDTRF
jgi:ATP synthase protein I